MTRIADFLRKVKLAAYQRAGGPDKPRCECWREAAKPGSSYQDCGGQPITKSDPPEYHHLYEAESGDTPERVRWLRSLDNCACVRRSCHQVITGTVTAPKIAKSRRQRAMQARAKKSRNAFPTNRGGRWKARIGGGVERR